MLHNFPTRFKCRLCVSLHSDLVFKRHIHMVFLLFYYLYIYDNKYYNAEFWVLNKSRSTTGCGTLFEYTALTEIINLSRILAPKLDNNPRLLLNLLSHIP